MVPSLHSRSMELKDQIVSLVEAQLEGTDYFLVDVLVSGPKKVSKIAVLVDGDNGISIDACVEISRALGAELEQMDLIPGAYTLEVSSPGLDQPLKFSRQYLRNVGRNIRLHLLNGTEKTGKLESVTGSGIILHQAIKGKKKEAEVPQLAIPFSDIDKAYVLVSFK